MMRIGGTGNGERGTGKVERGTGNVNVIVNDIGYRERERDRLS